MIITYFRSSLLNTYDWCPLKCLLEYSYSFKFPSNQKAELGTIIHKTMELIAHLKLAKQNNQSNFYDSELKKEFSIETPFLEFLINSYVFYKNQSSYVYTESEWQRCQFLLNEALTYKQGAFNPVNKKVLSPEKYFDFEIEKKWGNYKFEIGDQKISGKLKLKGSMDLITEIDLNTIENIDYKTGKRFDWGKEKEKNISNMRSDIQLRLYHYALRKLYPDYKYFILSLFYIVSGGVFSVYFDDNDIMETERILEDLFFKITNDNHPRANCSWKCRFCPFYKEKINENTYCQFFQQQLNQIGIDKLNKVYYNYEKSQQYTGGGKTIT